jgi:hypothetical protein
MNKKIFVLNFGSYSFPDTKANVGWRMILKPILSYGDVSWIELLRMGCSWKVLVMMVMGLRAP